MACLWVLPTHPSHGGVNAGFALLSQRLQSLPGVPGHGSQGPSTIAASQGSQPCGVALVSLGPGRQRGPSQSDGIGMRDHIEPCGTVPLLTKTGVGTGVSDPFLCTIACWLRTKLSGVRWKHSSVSDSDSGQRRYESAAETRHV
jgi:hypothetical protein